MLDDSIKRLKKLEKRKNVRELNREESVVSAARKKKIIEKQQIFSMQYMRKIYCFILVIMKTENWLEL